MNLFRLCGCRPCRGRVPTTREELERTTDVFFIDLMENSETEVNEACLTEGDKFVACTAKFTDTWDIIPLRPDLCPKDIDAKFEIRKAALALAAQSTCSIGVKYGNPAKYTTGTAFFVGPTTLITAAHVVPDNKARVVAHRPGIRRGTPLVESLFNGSLPSTWETIECKCLGTGLPDVDIAVLEVVGMYKAEGHLEIDERGLKPDDFVDILGYPGNYDERYVHNMHSGPLDLDLFDDVFALFPRCQLVVTHGPVVQGGIMPTYRISTVRGMSGSPVILDGKVKGVHIGLHSGSANRCVSVEWTEVKKLLETHGVIKTGNTLPKVVNEGKKRSFKFFKSPSGKSESTVEDDEEERTASQTQIRHKPDRLSSSMILGSPY